MPAQKAQEKSTKSMSFEESLTELEGIVRGLETGKAPLEDSITAYERGMELKQHCEAKLKDAQAKIDKIIIKKDGSIATQPLDDE